VLVPHISLRTSKKVKVLGDQGGPVQYSVGFELEDFLFGEADDIRPTQKSGLARTSKGAAFGPLCIQFLGQVLR